MSTLLLSALAGGIVLLYLLPLVLAVIALRFGPPMKVPSAAAVDVAWLEAHWIDGARPTLEQLEGLGFVLRTWLDGMSPRTSPTGMRCVALLVNETTGDVAQVAVMERLDDRGDVELITIPVFAFDVGSKHIVTSNADTPGVFLRPGGYSVQSFPMLYNVATLYAAHRGICERHVGAGKRGTTPRPGTEVLKVNRDSAEEFAYQARRGLMKVTPEGPYERTWRGAIHGVWRLHPRFIGWHRRRIHARGLRTLQVLGVTPDPVLHVERPKPARAGDQLSPEMDAFIANACEEYAAGSQRLQDGWHLDQATRFEADLTTGTVRFHFADGRTVLGDIQVLGTWSREAKSWEWAWNNPNIASNVKPDGERVREFGEKNGIAYLGVGFVPAPSIDIGAYLAALAAKLVGATGVIPLPPDADADVVAFVALNNLRTVQSTAA